ncbi:hypothetical protein X777_15992 [Ooceraea biroi]|uniref:Uncharacterized protein n=1 Tax=Ooceraea biroi TaxID=2015173 RepID=A0A026WUK1_OOCBI|nr:hypothetical protein X777_15992 [Ooceraea biroi]
MTRRFLRSSSTGSTEEPVNATTTGICTQTCSLCTAVTYQREKVPRLLYDEAPNGYAVLQGFKLSNLYSIWDNSRS